MPSLIFLPYNTNNRPPMSAIEISSEIKAMATACKGDFEIQCSELDGKLSTLVGKIKNMKSAIDEIAPQDYATQVYFKSHLTLSCKEHAAFSHAIKANLVMSADHVLEGNRVDINFEEGGSRAIAKLRAEHSLELDELMIDVELIIPISIEDENLSSGKEYEFVSSEDVENDVLTLQRMLLAKGNKRHSLSSITTPSARKLNTTVQMH